MPIHIIIAGNASNFVVFSIPIVISVIIYVVLNKEVRRGKRDWTRSTRSDHAGHFIATNEPLEGAVGQQSLGTTAETCPTPSILYLRVLNPLMLMGRETKWLNVAWCCQVATTAAWGPRSKAWSNPSASSQVQRLKQCWGQWRPTWWCSCSSLPTLSSISSHHCTERLPQPSSLRRSSSSCFPPSPSSQTLVQSRTLSNFTWKIWWNNRPNISSMQPQRVGPFFVSSEPETGHKG